MVGQSSTVPGSEAELDDVLTTPTERLGAMMGRLSGEILVLGAGGKMGVSLAGVAARAMREAGINKQVRAVSRFTNAESRARLDAWGVETISCDLLDRRAVAELPRAENVIFMAGRKFGTSDSQEMTWAVNTLVPAEVAHHFRDSRIVAFSTGCVYPPVEAACGGSREADPPCPVGEYSQSCLGRERVFQFSSKTNGTEMVLFRLNYAIDLRYGILHDVGGRIWAGEPVDGSVTHFNVIWQGDANERALLCLEHCQCPPAILNVTGAETLSLIEVAESFGKQMNKAVRYCGQPGPVGYLSDASRSLELFGPPLVSADQMVAWTARWIMDGGASLGKPTHFEVTDGKF